MSATDAPAATPPPPVSARLSERFAGLPFHAIFWVIAGLVVLRVIGLVISPVQLHGDEAQYWAWSQTLEWGYFSKPPLIAWAIAFTTGLFGEAEWAVRLAAPFTHGLAAVLLALAGRELGGPRVGVWAALLYLTMPGVWLSSAVVSTDAFMLPCMAGVIFSVAKLYRGGGLVWGVTLGIAIGVGFLAKYAMIYGALGVGLAAVVAPELRRALFGPAGLIAAALAAAIAAPNLMWNASNDFATVSHTAANANWQSYLFRPGKLADFLIGQLGVFGPGAIAALIAAVVATVRVWRGRRRRIALMLICFIVPALAVVATQAFISRAHANWAAASYVAASVLVALWTVWSKRERLMALVVASHVIAGLTFAAMAVSPALADALGMSNAFKRARGWEATTTQVRTVYDAGFDGRPFAVAATDNRLVFHGLEFYGRDEPLPLAAWRTLDGPQNHAEAQSPLDHAAVGDGVVLIVSERGWLYDQFKADFAKSTELGVVRVPLGGGRERVLHMAAGEGYAPQARDAAYVERWAAYAQVWRDVERGRVDPSVLPPPPQ